MDMTSASAGSLTAADQHLVDGVLAGRRRALAKTITLVESTHMAITSGVPGRC
jgi:LAO/AO transport system kinase